MRFHNLTKNVTDNTAFGRQKSNQQREASKGTGKETDRDKMLLTYVHGVEKPIKKVVDLSQIYSDLQAGEKRSSKMDLPPPKICTIRR